MGGMRLLELTRYMDDGKATLGKLYGYFQPDSQPVLDMYTIERPWQGNRPSVSCIPAGFYQMTPQRYNRGGYNAYEVLNVIERTHILIHVANWAHDVQGCIGVGERATVDRHAQLMVTPSNQAFQRFMGFMDGHAGALIVRDHAGQS